MNRREQVDLVRNQQWSILSLSENGSKDSARLCRSAQTNKRSVDLDISVLFVLYFLLVVELPPYRSTSNSPNRSRAWFSFVSVRLSFSCEISFRQGNNVALFEQRVRPGCVYAYIVLVEIEIGKALITELAKNTPVTEEIDNYN